jgi:hypothetical protein
VSEVAFNRGSERKAALNLERGTVSQKPQVVSQQVFLQAPHFTAESLNGPTAAWRIPCHGSRWPLHNGFWTDGIANAPNATTGELQQLTTVHAFELALINTAIHEHLRKTDSNLSVIRESGKVYMQLGSVATLFRTDH